MPFNINVVLLHELSSNFSILFFCFLFTDWTTPLTPPSTHHHRHYHNHQELSTSLTQSSLSLTDNIINHANNNEDKTASNVTNTADSNHVNTQIAAFFNIADDDTLQVLTSRLQNELRTAKSQHLACTEVLLPVDLLHRVASEMIVMSEKEPCGIRGCTVYIEFEDEPSNTR